MQFIGVLCCRARRKQWVFIVHNQEVAFRLLCQEAQLRIAESVQFLIKVLGILSRKISLFLLVVAVSRARVIADVTMEPPTASIARSRPEQLCFLPMVENLAGI